MLGLGKLKLLAGLLSSAMVLSIVPANLASTISASTFFSYEGQFPSIEKTYRSVEDYSYSAEVKTVSTWSGHANMEIKFTNTGSSTIHDWYFTFDYNYAIENPFNCYIVEQNDNLYTIGNNNWNQDIKPGQSVTIGFTAASSDGGEITDAPSFYLLNTKTVTLSSSDLTYTYEQYSDWGAGYNGALILTNNSGASIRDWSMTFGATRPITQIDSAVLTSDSDGTYTITNDGNNQNISNGQNYRIGLQGGEHDTSVAFELTDLTVSAKKLAYSLDDDTNGNGILDVLEIDVGGFIAPTATPTPEETPVPTSEPTPFVVDNPFLKLRCDEDEFLTDIDFQYIIFFAETNLPVSSINVVDSDGNKLCTLYDDGDYLGHWDDIGGDGVFSGRGCIITQEEMTYSFHAVTNYNGAEISSGEKKVYVYLDITDQDWEDMDAAEVAIYEYIISSEFKALSHSEKVDALIDLMTDISINGVEGYEYSLIVPGSIYYDEIGNSMEFTYACGLPGGFTFEDLDPLLGGVTPSITPSNSPTPTATVSPTPTATPMPTVPPQPNTNTDYSGDAIFLYSFTNTTDPNAKRDVLDGYIAIGEDLDNYCGLETRVIPNFTVDDLRTCFADKDLIATASHGGYSGHPHFTTIDRYTTARNTTKKDLRAGRLSEAGLSSAGYYNVYGSFIEYYYSDGQLLEGSIFMVGGCHSYGDTGNLSTELIDAILNAGAEATITFTDAVYQLYPMELFDEFCRCYIEERMSAGESYGKALEKVKTTDSAWWEARGGTNTAGRTPSMPHFAGDEDYYWAGTNTIRNGNFEKDLKYWKTGGDARVVYQLGNAGEDRIMALEGQKMAIITTGTGSGESAYLSGSNESYIKQNIVLMQDNRHLTFSYNMVSEEVTEFVGSRYDDTFIVYAVLYDGSRVEIVRNSINTATWKDAPDEVIQSVNFPGGDDTAYQTGWIFVEVDLEAIGAGNIKELVFAVTDVGDSAYDTVVLIDDVELD